MKENRYLTFTFDDGLLDGAKKIDKILDPHKATFYIVTGWLEPNAIPITDKSNVGCNHGTLEDWKNLSNRGHDIGSHSVSHTKPTDLTKIKSLQTEYELSLNVLKSIQTGPYSASFPYNQIYRITADYNTVRVGDTEPIYRLLNDVNVRKIIPWSPWPESLPLWRIKWKIGQVPSNSWVVLGLHSLDGEGWQPWKSKELKSLKNYLVRKGIKIKTMKQMYEIIK